MKTVDIKQEIEKLRLELEEIIESERGAGVYIDDKLYELSRQIDELINTYIKEQQKTDNK